MNQIWNQISVFVLLCTLLSATLATPECYIYETKTKCALQDSVCLTKKSNDALKSFTDGIPELGIEKLDKMYIDFIEMNKDGVIHELKNLQIEGLRNATINELSFNEALKLIRLSFDTTLVADCDYTMDGFLFMQPIYGVGTSSFTIRNIQTDLIFFYDIIKQGNGKHMLDIKDYRYGLLIKGGVEFGYANMFRGDTKKNEIVNEFLNENWSVITNVFGDNFYNKIYNKIFKAIKTYTRSQNLEDMILFSQ